MQSVFHKLMLRLYGRNIWDEFKFEQDSVAHQGWNGKNAILRRLASLSSNPVILDVGVWKGESTITIVTALRDGGIDGCVISIDTFLGSAEHWASEGHLFKRKLGRPDVYDTFLANVASMELQNYVIPLPQNSSAAATILKQLGVTASAVHIDASHEYQDVMRDASDYWALLRPGGYLVGDDYDPSWPDVVRAAHDFSDFVHKPLVALSPKWLIQKSN